MAGNTIGIGKGVMSFWLMMPICHLYFSPVVIFIAMKPMIKMAVIAGGGAYFAKKGLLTPEACKANASMIMNLLLPLLIFATVLPAFDSDNMTSVLSVVITGLLYQVMGLTFGLIVRCLTPIPASWKGGVLAAGIFSNLGDLVIAYISTLGKSDPFNGDADTWHCFAWEAIAVAKGIAYSSVFMVVQMIAIFNLGGLQLIKRDFDSHDSLPETEKPHPTPSTFSLLQSIKILTRTITRKPLPPPPDSPLPQIDEKASPASTIIPTPSVIRRIWTTIQPFITPPSIAMAISLVVANVPVLKSLFVKTPGIHMPEAPDHQPPLDFVMDVAGFAGVSVPVLGLLLLGAALSRLNMKGLPKGFWKAAVLMAVLKLIVGPVIGIAWTTGLSKRTSWVPSEDKMLQLVMIIGSAVPTATAQVYLTNIFAPLGPEGCVEMSALSAILLAQYALMLITLTAAVCYTFVFVI